MKITEEQYAELLASRRRRAAIDEHKTVTPETKPEKRRPMEAIRPAKVTRLELVLPIQLVSVANKLGHEHWATSHKRNKKQQLQFAGYWSRLVEGIKIVPPVTIRLTRIGKRKIDSGNMEVSFKHLQDSIARIIGCDDGSELLTWEYSQITGAKEYGVKVEFICQ